MPNTDQTDADEEKRLNNSEGDTREDANQGRKGGEIKPQNQGSSGSPSEAKGSASDGDE